MEVLATLRGSKLGLRAHLVIFGLAIVVPVLVYSAFLLHRYTQSVHASNEGRAQEIARALNADLDREVTAIITTLETLATSRPLLYRDFPDFYAQAKEALRSRSVERGADRRQSPAARQHAPAVGNAAARERGSRARPAAHREGDGASVHLGPVPGTVAKRPIFAVSVPVRQRNEFPTPWSCRWSRSV